MSTEHSDVGRYRLLSLLGRGGMGEVYLAEDQTLGRKVAIKFVSGPDAGDREGQRRLLKEARAAASLDHPNICTVYETGETPDGRPYIVMQYVEGETLSTILQRGPLPIRDALAAAAHMAEALAAAHHRGVVHRDLKPSNVVMTPAGLPKLLDFGIAKIAARHSDIGTHSATESTAAGMIVGTPAYMSPEQVQAREVDGRSDLFSLGAILFECLTGRRAFAGTSAVETAAAVLHLHPPAPSGLRAGVTAAHDELCRRLLAKDPADRFASADEVVGAIRVLLPDTSRSAAGDSPQRLPRPVPRPPSRAQWLLLAVTAVVAMVGTASAWYWARRPALAPVPDVAATWYQRGTEAIREGSYETARRAFVMAIRLFPQYALAYARLAETDAELDDASGAHDELLRVAQLVPNESRLPEHERLRLRAVRSLVLRDVDAAVAAYAEIVKREPADFGAWLDLGRAQEAAGLLGDARASYRQAIDKGPQYASGYLRLGAIEAQESNRDQALAALREAEQLYRAASDHEGETEVLLRRGAMFDTFNELKEAHTDLDRALLLATASSLTYQRVRIQLSLSSVTASEGRFADSERIASAAVQEALTAGLDTVAADGLTDLAATLLQRNRLAEAEQQVRRAIEMADPRGARRTAARARVQLAAVLQKGPRPGDALPVLDQALPFLKTNRYRRYELLALSIASRVHQGLDALDRAHQMAADVLAGADGLKDEGQIALASANLASITTDLGGFPQALTLRDRAEAIHRRQGDTASLPFDLANRADLLIRLGRNDDADRLLDELESGIAKGIDPYVSRARRRLLLRGTLAAAALRCDEVLRFLGTIPDGPPRDGTAVLGPALADWCRARRGERASIGPPAGGVERSLLRERAFWLGWAALERGDAAGALDKATQGLSLLGSIANDELRWRLNAVGALAARRARNDAAAGAMSAASARALDAVRTDWKDAFASYERRLDIAELRRRLGSGGAAGHTQGESR